LVKPIGHFVGLVLLCIVSISLAHTVQHSASLQIHTVQFYECSFRLTDPFFGKIDDDVNSSSGPYVGYSKIVKRGTTQYRLDIDFDCATGNHKLCEKFRGATHSENGAVEWFTPDARPLPEYAQVERHALRSTNGSGLVVLYSDVAEGIATRQRYLSFCLTSPTGAVLSGVSAVDMLDSSHKSMEPKVMTLLKGIEFVHPRVPVLRAGKPF